MRFYVGLHHPSDAVHFRDRPVMVSVAALQHRRLTALRLGHWMLDSGAFSDVSRTGDHTRTAMQYAHEAAWWSRYGQLDAAVAQDYMCEPRVLARTGLTFDEHQARTIARYDALLAARVCRWDGAPMPWLPVLQGFAPAEYVHHLRAYGNRLALGQWTGVGTLCKRNGKPADVLAILDAILTVRPDLRLHGFGLKLTALRVPEIRARLHSADSMAWSYSARKQGRDGNDWREAARFAARVEAL